MSIIIPGDSAEMFDGTNLDLDLDDAVEQTLRQKIEMNEPVVSSTNAYLASVQNFWASLKDIGEGEDISIAEYLKRHPEILKAQESLCTELFGLKWTQTIKESSLEERRFLSRMREIAKGRFVEIIVIIAILEDGTQVKELAFSASGNEVEEEDLVSSIQVLLAKIKHRKPSKVFLIHNHPDQMATSKIKSIQKDPTIGLVSNNSLTDRDVKSADSIQSRFFNETSLSMIAISENGLTYEYQAGSSESIS